MNRPPPDFDRTPLRPDRLRKIDGSFAFLPHRFLRHGFWASLDHRELLLYVLLALVADRQGMSFYFDDRLAAILRFVLDDFLAARAGLLRKDLVAYDPAGPRYQLLALPPRPVIAATPSPAPRAAPTAATHPGPIGNLIRDWLTAHADDDR
ncbi:MAG: hypothetical protein GYA57_03205 [Myxococcales bacterium]|nr:hypothetical protein [Myxococcales bacterium]